MSDDEKPAPTAGEILRAQRDEGSRKLFALYTQRRRLAHTLATLDATIAAHESDIDAIDKVLGILP